MDDACSIAVADIGGTNARFARADLSQNGTVQLHEPVVLPTASYPDLPSAWAEFLKRSSDFAPEGAALALAGPVGNERFKLTNAAWEFDTANLAAELGLEQIALLNDFAAIAHAVAGDE
ncbi:MAG: glucokinase, partial [Pseudomonadota bacterium]